MDALLLLVVVLVVIAEIDAKQERIFLGIKLEKHRLLR